MSSHHGMMHNLGLILLLALTLLLSSCGYVVKKGQFDSLKVGDVENRSFEHGLEDKLRTALTEELMRNGIKIDKTAPYRINGVIEAFKLNPVAQKDGIAVSFNVQISGKFVLEGPEGSVITIKEGLLTPFPVSFSGEGPLEALTALKEEAIEGALKDISAELVFLLLSAKEVK